MMQESISEIARPVDIRDLIAQLRTDRDFVRRVAAWERLPAREARTAPFPASLDPRLIAALKSRGIESFYTHQAQAIEAVARGEHIAVVTSTASGKTLCYNLPVLNAMLRQPAATALYIFPTKALAQDQLAVLRELIEALGTSIPAQTYDGDTPRDRRRSTRSAQNAGGLLITNPDMLHTGILPHHTQWASLFQNLRFVVFDELHTYRGVFGSHLANVIRRLKRIAAFYGAAPQFITCSATIANPLELAQKLLDVSPDGHSEPQSGKESHSLRVETLRFAQGDTARKLTLIDDDGAPRGEKHFIMLNPPMVDKELGQRRSYTLEARDVAARFLAAGIQTIVFARARLTTEVLLTYIREAAGLLGVDPQTIRGYRGGYLAEERRAIERGLRDGSVRGVVATNALELGVDIGQLGAAVLAGYPGTIASAWQQAGRAGRRTETSIAVMVASASPLDQYLAAHPRYFFERSPEHGLIAPDNLVILLNHLRCAAFELPFEIGEAFGSAGPVTEFLDVLAEEGLLHRSGKTFRWIADAYPASGLSLRSGTDDTIAIINRSAGSPLTIGQMDRPSAPMLIHAGAIYLHEGQQYLVEQLDWDAGQALVSPVQVDYYTDASSSSDVRVLAESSREDRGVTAKSHGEVLITTLVTGYRKVKMVSHEVLGWGEVALPEQQMTTSAYWLSVSEAATEKLLAAGILLWPNDYGPAWNSARDAARARDAYRCRSCGAPERGDRQHDVHHLRPFREFGYVRGVNDNDRLANALDNLITLCPACHHRAEMSRGVRTTLGGLAHALGNLAPLYLMCDPRDIGTLAEQKSAFSGLPTITLYERVPAGIGFAQTLYELHDELLGAARDLIASCPCDGGCPACIGPGAVSAEAKQHTLQLLNVLTGK
jgi:DEAD/DEAH box helicase domain-containing protein